MEISAGAGEKRYPYAVERWWREIARYTNHVVHSGHRFSPGSDARLLVVAVVVGVAPFDPNFSLRWGAAICTLMLLSAAGQFKFRLPEVTVALFLILAFASQSWTESSYHSGLAVKNLTACIIIFVTIRALVTTRHAAGIVGGGYLLGCTYTTWKLYQVGTANQSLLADSGSARATLEGNNSNYLSYSLVAGLVVLVLLWVTKQPAPAVGVVMIGAGFAFVLGIGLTGTRGSQLAVAVLATWVVLARSNPSRWIRPLIALSALANFIIVFGVLDSAVQERLTRSARETGDLNGRFPSWVQGRQVFADHLFHGAGIDAFRSLNNLQINAHNFILDIGTGLGIFGLASMFGLLYAALFHATRSIHDRKRHFIVGAWIAALLPILSSGVWFQAAPLWVTLALVSALPSFVADSPDAEGTPGIALGDRRVPPVSA